MCSKAMAYQCVLRKFGQFDRVWLSEPLPLVALLSIGLAQPASGWQPEDGDQSTVCCVYAFMRACECACACM